MADVSNDLRDLAEGLRTQVRPALVALVEENTRLAQRNEELEAAEAGRAEEDVRESSAAADARTAFNDTVAVLVPVEGVPNVEPMPEPEAPVVE